MIFATMAKQTIVKCDNPICQATFSVTAYVFEDLDCHIISSAQMVPLTGNTPYFCPVCGKNLGAMK
ncbi:hypothetical protein LCGC14_1457240 [marine sediment metagenome]|uniref:Uncharacterized protein n=1 Tax=marine sediment metagenome TaxID=412755 RepID=A0A0F9LWT5_9ZZZZ